MGQADPPCSLQQPVQEATAQRQLLSAARHPVPPCAYTQPLTREATVPHHSGASASGLAEQDPVSTLLLKHLQSYFQLIKIAIKCKEQKRF